MSLSHANLVSHNAPSTRDRAEFSIVYSFSKPWLENFSVWLFLVTVRTTFSGAPRGSRPQSQGSPGDRWAAMSRGGLLGPSCPRFCAMSFGVVIFGYSSAKSGGWFSAATFPSSRHASGHAEQPPPLSASCRPFQLTHPLGVLSITVR